LEFKNSFKNKMDKFCILNVKKNISLLSLFYRKNIFDTISVCRKINKIYNGLKHNIFTLIKQNNLDDYIFIFKIFFNKNKGKTLKNFVTKFFLNICFFKIFICIENSNKNFNKIVFKKKNFIQFFLKFPSVFGIKIQYESHVYTIFFYNLFLFFKLQLIDKMAFYFILTKRRTIHGPKKIKINIRYYEIFKDFFSCNIMKKKDSVSSRVFVTCKNGLKEETKTFKSRCTILAILHYDIFYKRISIYKLKQLMNFLKFFKNSDDFLGTSKKYNSFEENSKNWKKIKVKIPENFFFESKKFDINSNFKSKNFSYHEIGENYIQVNNINYLKLKIIGKGGTSKVYKVINHSKEIFALKKSKIQNFIVENLHNCINEISILKALKGKTGIIDLEDADISLKYGQMYIVLELGDCDLEYILTKNSKILGKNPFVKFLWKNMLRSVQAIHGERIVHGDLKPANFLIVNNSLKIIDFGIARGIQKDTTNITRNIQIGTINYMSPEAISDIPEVFGKKKKIKLSRSTDIWSLGCILFQIFYGQTPFFHLSIGKKIQALTEKSVHLSFLPLDLPGAIDVLRNCLRKKPDSRPSIPELLNHPFLTLKEIDFSIVKGKEKNSTK